MMRSVSVLVAIAACSGGGARRPRPGGTASRPVTAPAPRPAPEACADCELQLSTGDAFRIADDDRVSPEPGSEPASDCRMVGELRAVGELGNHADEVQYTELVARYAASCEMQGRISAGEHTCIVESRDLLSLAYCASRLVPGNKLEIVAPGECAAIIRDNEKATNAAYGPRISDVQTQFERDAAGRSCEQDRWTRSIALCVRNPGLMVLSNCRNLAPSALRTKLDARIQAAAARQVAYERAIVDARTCTTIADRHRTLLVAAFPRRDDPNHQTFRKVVRVTQQSCTEDRWPRGFATCMLSAPLGSPLDYCGYKADAKLLGKLRARFARIKR